MKAPGCMVDGNPAAPLLAIAMAPGREELAADKTLVGGSGRLFWGQLLKKAGLSRSDVYSINTIGEWPEGVDGNPTKVQFDRWWEAFDEAVSLSRARVAVLLGRAALWRFTGIQGGIEDWRGYVVGVGECSDLTRTVEREGVYKTSNKTRGIKKGDPKIEHYRAVVPAPWPQSVQWAIPTIHPAAVLRTGFGLLPAFAADIKRVGRALRGELALTEPKWTEGVPVVAELPNPGQPVVADIETGGMDNDIITRIGCTGGDGVWTALWDNGAREALRQSLGAGPTVAFNIGFDAPRLENNGVTLPEPWWDVMLAAALSKPDLKKSLNYVASLYLDKRRHKHLSADQPAFYNAMDVADTRDLYYVLRGELERTGQLDLFEKRMMPAVPVLVRMTKRGIKVDQQRRADWVIELTGRRDYALAAWEQMAPGMKTSGKKLLDWMYGPLGLPTQYHKHGGITSEVSGIKRMLLSETLTNLQRDILVTMLELRSVEKELRTYAEVELGGDGCVHPGYLPAGKDSDAFGKGIAGTGRIIASDPNIQNQPQVARRMYIPHGPDMVLVEADYSQIEARIIAQLSGDDALKKAIAEGLHASNMAALGVDKTRAKNGFYGWAYGAGKRTLHNAFISKGFNISERDCEILLRGFDRRYAVAAAWRRRVASEVSSRYYLTNAFGRRRYFMGGSRDVPAGLDFHPQSCAADVLWSVLRPLDDRLRGTGAAILAPVHDSVLVECPNNAVVMTANAMREIMEQPWPELGGLRVPVEIKVGKSWGQMEALQ